MSTLFCYSIAMGIFLLAGYGAYRMFLSGEKQPGLNRVMLLSLYLVGIVAWPLMGLPPPGVFFPAWLCGATQPAFWP